MSKLMEELVPKGPPDLCFESSAFTKESFSVDQFLQDHRSGGNLETMRDDLGVYLKVLRSAMIDLINKDYADYVNLSSNLMGLDKAIGKINAPLGQLKEELLQVNQYMSDAVSEMTRKLEVKKALRERKRSLRSLSRVRILLGKLDKLLRGTSECDAGLCLAQPLDEDSVERAVFEFSQLQFNSERCLHLMSHAEKQSYEEIGQVLLSNVSRLFVESVEAGEAGVERLSHTLVYCLNINRHIHIERLYRERLVSPWMEPLITKESLKSIAGGLVGLYNKILLFIDKDMKHLLDITSSNSSRGLSMYEFLLRCVWPEVETRLQVNLASIYDAGDPDAFYTRYKETIRFLEEFGKRFRRDESRRLWYQLDSFNSLVDKWNVAVYFQIRFQEIVRGVESGLSRGREETTVESSDNVKWKLVATETLWSNLVRCWSPGVVILPIADKMWKLTLQIFSRYLTWIKHTLSSGKGGDDSERTQVLVFIRCDVQTLIGRLPLVEQTAFDTMPRLSPTTRSSLFRSLEECGKSLSEKLKAIDDAIVVCLSARCSVQLRQVSDIPRLYRRTNRESPTKPCLYVTAMMQPALDLAKSHSALSSSLWLQSVFSDLTKQYYRLVSEVLTSVQKTEESLRRLKKARDNRSQGVLAPSQQHRTADDDKIRLQLLIDVNFYASQIDSLGIKRNSVEMLTELLLLVESTKKL